uniref:hypothetical protein n=1 Tax=Algoriphagus sp. TaxID=1872435 RepID=UPI0040487C6F
MNWVKKGFIYSPDGELWWNKKYSILPTPIYLEKLNVIRVYFGVTCENNFGRITFIDLDPDFPFIIKDNPNLIALDLGKDGAFDDCGVNPSCILKYNNEWFLYYAGFQRHFKTPYSIFSGLAKSSDGLTFSRVQNTPILERTNSELSLRSAPSVIFENNSFKMIYVADHGWKEINTMLFEGKKMPMYGLKYCESSDGINWKFKSKSVLMPRDDEFGFGRPYLFKDKEIYKLFYSIRCANKSYRLGYAESFDCIEWYRKDNNINIDVSDSGWDSEMMCYPAVLNVKNKTFLFYNGNNNGETGFGYAELINK